MGTKAVAPVGSRWLAKDGKRVFVVRERKPFGVLEIKQEDRAYFGQTRQRDFIVNFTRLKPQ